jgi:hypothetical protein
MRLQQLVDHLKTLDGGFDMRHYCLKLKECRSSACALGHGCDVFEQFTLVDCPNYPYMQLQFDGYDVEYDSVDVLLFFDITKSQADHLFGPCDRTLATQISVMETFINAKSDTAT